MVKKTVVYYHGSKRKFEVLDKAKLCGGIAGRGFYFVDSISFAGRFGNYIYTADINTEELKLFKLKKWAVRCIMSADVFNRCLGMNGYDGLIYKGKRYTTIVLFEPTAVTRVTDP